jgi:hypothetical protein
MRRIRNLEARVAKLEGTGESPLESHK